MMQAMGEVVWDLFDEETNEYGLPPGFRFHPTDEELVTYYLAPKVFNGDFGGVEIVEVDLNKCEPWELPDMAKMGEREWYFFSLRDRKYPTGLRTNRATGAGYWKATGKDREVFTASNGALVGMKKTLVFYKGRAPRGEKTKWVLHEYRLEGDFSCRQLCQEEWVVCRMFHKAGGEKKNPFHLNHRYFLDPSSSSSSWSQTQALPSLLMDLQTLENPVQTLLQSHPYYQYNHLSSSISISNSHPFSPASNITSLLKSYSHPKETNPVPIQCCCCCSFSSNPSQQEEAIFSWTDTNPQNPFVFDTVAGPLGPCVGGGAAAVHHDLPLLAGESGPLVP